LVPVESRVIEEEEPPPINLYPVAGTIKVRTYPRNLSSNNGDLSHDVTGSPLTIYPV
jgi:hypothetical protein